MRNFSVPPKSPIDDVYAFCRRWALANSKGESTAMQVLQDTNPHLYRVFKRNADPRHLSARANARDRFNSAFRSAVEKRNAARDKLFKVAGGMSGGIGKPENFNTAKRLNPTLANEALLPPDLAKADYIDPQTAAALRLNTFDNSPEGDGEFRTAVSAYLRGRERSADGDYPAEFNSLVQYWSAVDNSSIQEAARKVASRHPDLADAAGVGQDGATLANSAGMANPAALFPGKNYPGYGGLPGDQRSWTYGDALNDQTVQAQTDNFTSEQKLALGLNDSASDQQCQVALGCLGGVCDPDLAASKRGDILQSLAALEFAQSPFQGMKAATDRIISRYPALKP